MFEKNYCKNFQQQFEICSQQQIISLIKNGAVGILPTDTLYGIVASAQNQQAVEKIYALRQRELNKPLIVLIAELQDLKLFGVETSAEQQIQLQKLWPEKISIVFECTSSEFFYLHRGANSIAFRLPKNEELRDFLKKSGPLVAPSANLAGRKPATTVQEAQDYFYNKLDFFVDAGKMESEPSTLIKLDKEGKITVLRRGAIETK